MTPADLAMKNALDESVRYARSPPRMMSAVNPLLGGQPQRNVTSFGSHLPKSSETIGPSLNTPVSPHLTLHQFRKFQQSPALSSSPDLDYKRVRRKRALANLTPRTRAAEQRSANITSLSPSGHLNSTHNFLPPLLPPLPLTPVPRPSTASPSLSSSVDTLQSTPTHTPIQTGSSPLEQWRSVERIEVTEQIRTKRKFANFKAAKRLPHIIAQREEGEGTWEVHAAVIDLRDVDRERLRDFEDEAVDHVTSAEKRPQVRSSGSRRRAVRFEGIGAEKDREFYDSRASEIARSGEEREPTLTSSYSLSKFKFSAPPGYTWAGTFGHLDEPTPPTSPATVHYRGASFDVVNPHTSLLLGNSDIETPGEIDGLLDDYFSSRETLPRMPYQDRAGERSTSQHSVQTTSSTGRGRVLYDDPESARRTIMGLSAGSSQQNVIHDPDTPPLPIPPYATPGNEPPQAAQDMGPYSDRETDEQSGIMGGYDVLEEDGRARQQEGENMGTQAMMAERASSLYPQSQRSDPFDLTISGIPDDNIDGRIGAGRTSYYAGSGALYDQEENFAVYEDGPDANASQYTLAPDTTLGNIVSHYDYNRPPLQRLSCDPADYEDVDDDDCTTIDLGRPEGPENPFQDPSEEDAIDLQAGNASSDARVAGRLPGRSMYTFGSLNFPPPPSRIGGPPSAPAPTPQASGLGSRNPYGGYYSGYTDLPASDQTYGNTGQLLHLTPQQCNRPQQSNRWPFLGSRNNQSNTTTRQVAPHGGESTAAPHTPSDAHSTRLPSPYDDDEDKENTPPEAGTEGTSMASYISPSYPRSWEYLPSRARVATITDAGPGIGAHRALPRSSSIYPDDDSIWESTQASESNSNLPSQDTLTPAEQDARPSQDSYADTSACGSSHRLSLPPPLEPTTPGFPPLPTRAGGLSGRRLHTGNIPLSASGQLPEVVESDEIKACNILEKKLVANPNRKSRQHNADMKELEQIRKKNPNAVERAVGTVAEKLGNLSPMQPIYSPQNDFWKEAHASSSRMHQGTASETVGLLDEDNGPYMSGGMQYSGTANTFQTARRTAAFNMGPAVAPYSPLSPTPVTPPAHALLRGRTDTNSTRATFGYQSPEPTYSENIEMKTLRRPKQVSRAAMSSQTELRPLTLADSTTPAANTGRLTDAQLVAAEPGWTTRPHLSANNQHAGPATFGMRSTAAAAEEGRLLRRPDDDRTAHTRRIQKDFTRNYYRGAIICPVTALIFALGGFDFKMRQMTNGRITEMSPTAKRSALLRAVPLGTIFYVAIALAIALLIEKSKTK